MTSQWIPINYFEIWDGSNDILLKLWKAMEICNLSVDLTFMTRSLPNYIILPEKYFVVFFFSPVELSSLQSEAFFSLF